MKRIRELFHMRSRSSAAELRRSAFFTSLPNLAGLHVAYDKAIESERNVKVPNRTSGTYDPDSLEDFRKIDPADLTPSVLEAGAIYTKRIAKEMGARYTRNYAELVRRLHASNPRAVEHIHGAFISDLMAAEYVLGEQFGDGRKAQVLKILATKYFVPGPLFALTVLLRAPEASPDGEWWKACLNDEGLKAMVLHRPARARLLCPPSLQRQQLLEEMIVDGFNPPGLAGNPMLSIRISEDMSLKDKMISLSKCKDAEHFELACARGFVKRYSIADVVSAADTWTLKGLLTSLYTRDELIPHIRNDHVAKGRLLEDELGL